MNFRKLLCSAAALFAAFALSASDTGVPGTFDNASPARMKDVLDHDKKLNPTADELVRY